MVETQVFVLIHSPLIGPYSWRPVAKFLEKKGHRIVVPSLVSALEHSDGFADAIGDAVAQELGKAEVPDPLILIAHNAAGAYLPFIGSVVDRKVSSYLFVDARLPTNGRSLLCQDQSGLRDQLQRLTSDGMLPPWSEWFGSDAIRELLPDPTLRETFVDELQPIPLALFEEPIPLAACWPEAQCAYIRLSEPYVDEAREARARGWHVWEIEGQHLYPLTHPKEVARLLLEAVDAHAAGRHTSSV